MSTPPARVLATTSRMPFAVDEIRKLGEAGNEVTAVDTFAQAPGSHSRYVARHLEVPRPAQDTEAFVAAISSIIDEWGIDHLVPMFEEVFYLAAHRDRLPSSCELFFPGFDTLARVHDKATFADLCRSLDLPVAQTIMATSDDELRAAVGSFAHWFARAAYGRGGLGVLTNTGPLAGDGSIDEVHPTADDPWLVQEFLEGVDLCSWSVVRDGTVLLHSTYEHPLTIEHRGGIVFEAVDAPATLEAARRIAEATGWTGQISFDFLRTADGVHHMVECNPRPTDGCTLATVDEFQAALFGPVPADPVVVPAGRKTEIKVAVVRDLFENLHHFREDLHAAKGGSDVYAQRHDLRPLLYTVLSLQHVKAYRKTMGLTRRDRKDLMAAQFYDVSWDGTPIA